MGSVPSVCSAQAKHLPACSHIASAMPTGVMKRWNSEKGFGFISPDDGDSDIFCHANDLLDGDGSVREGDKCKYRIEFDDRKGKDHAVNCERIGGGSGRGRDRSRSGDRGG